MNTNRAFETSLQRAKNKKERGMIRKFQTAYDKAARELGRPGYIIDLIVAGFVMGAAVVGLAWLMSSTYQSGWPFDSGGSGAGGGGGYSTPQPPDQHSW